MGNRASIQSQTEGGYETVVAGGVAIKQRTQSADYVSVCLYYIVITRNAILDNGI